MRNQDTINNRKEAIKIMESRITKESFILENNLNELTSLLKTLSSNAKSLSELCNSNERNIEVLNGKGKDSIWDATNDYSNLLSKINSSIGSISSDKSMIVVLEECIKELENN